MQNVEKISKRYASTRGMKQGYETHPQKGISNGYETGGPQKKAHPYIYIYIYIYHVLYIIHLSDLDFGFQIFGAGGREAI